MVAEGSFPFPGGLEGLDSSPRVGDGLRAARQRRHRPVRQPQRAVGLPAARAWPPTWSAAGWTRVTRQLVPRRGPVDEDLAAVAGGRTARGVEVEGKGTTVQLRAIPLLRRGDPRRAAWCWCGT